MRPKNLTDADMTRIYEEGRQAFLAKKSPSSCPYPDQERYDLWSKGYWQQVFREIE